MGANHSQKRKLNHRVVIIGGGFAGLALAELLWDTFSVVIIDRKDYFEYICTNPRALVRDSYIDDLTVPY
jgi:NADH dehydrogenase FAD-containing subunit